MQSIAKKTIVITGASSGIGLALARHCLEKNARVVMAARSLVPMQQMLASGGFSPDSCRIVQADVSRTEDCRLIVTQAISAFGGIDVLINNAGISMRAMFDKTDPDVIERLMRVNFFGSMYCTHYAMPWLLKSKGSVVGVSSVAGYKGLPARTGYSASKFALQGFLESLRIENLRTGLHVLIACPGFTSSNIRMTALSGDGTPQGESPRDESAMMSAEEVAHAIVRAVEQRRRTLILSRQGKLTVFLNRLFPALVDRLVYRHMAREADSPFK